MARTTDDIRDEMVDREAIRDCLVRISRAIDRIDLDAWNECFWPEATDSHAGFFSGMMKDIMIEGVPFLESLRSSTHFLGNILIEIEGNKAKAETYVFGCHVHDGPQARNVIGTGRYLDGFERRENEWRLISRNLVLDWFMNVPSDGEWSRPHYGHEVDGGRKPADYSYQFFKKRPSEKAKTRG